jgi:hypothetical protein
MKALSYRQADWLAGWLGGWVAGWLAGWVAVIRCGFSLAT